MEQPIDRTLAPDVPVKEINVNYIIPNPKQPRQVFDFTELESLSGSIKEHGVIMPLVVMEIEDDDGGKKYMLIAGERRLKAAIMADLLHVPCLVRQAEETTDQDLLEIALVENVQRADLNSIEEARAYQALADAYKLNHDQIAQRVGKKRETITNKISLLKLPPDVQEKLLDGSISERQAVALLGLYNLPEPMRREAETCWQSNIRPSVIKERALNGESSGALRDAVGEIVRIYGKSLAWHDGAVFAVPQGKPATCGDCPMLIKRNGQAICGDAECFRIRQDANRRQSLIDVPPVPPAQSPAPAADSHDSTPTETPACGVTGDDYHPTRAEAEEIDFGQAEDAEPQEAQSPVAPQRDPWDENPLPKRERPAEQAQPVVEQPAPAQHPQAMQDVQAAIAAQLAGGKAPGNEGPDWRHSTITITITLMPEDDDPAGRPVMLGLRANNEAPAMKMCREAQLELAGYLLAQVLELKSRIEGV